MAEALGHYERSPLIDAQSALGAKTSVSEGWEMAQAYSSSAEEASRVRTSAGLVDLSFFGVLTIRGGEAIQFLNGLVTNDVKALPDGNGMRAAFLTGHGKVRALCRVLRRGGEFLVVNDPQTHDKVLKYVSPFSHAGDFKVEDSSAAYRTISIQGPNAQLILKEICFEPVPALAEYAWFETLIAGHRALITRVSHTGELGFDILASATALGDIWDFILLKGQFHGLIPFGLEALETLRIEAGIPSYGVDVDESNMMLETGLADAVSFTKGCYTGQEAVAMATYRGHVSKKLSGLILTGSRTPKKGDAVSKDGKEIGFVTSATQSISLRAPIALAYLKYGFFDPGSSVEVKSESETTPALISELPFPRSPKSQ